MARKSKENKTVKKITDRKEIAALKKVEAPVLKKKRHMPKTSNDEIKEKAAAILKNALSGYNDLNLLAKKASVYQKDNVFTTLSNQTAGRNLKIDEELRRLEYNFAEIGKFEDMESIVSRAFSRKKELAIKQGYSIVSKNKKNLDFVKSRMLEIEEKSRMTTSEFIKQVISDLVSRHNAFIWKRRGKSVNPAASSYKINGQVKEPIESLVVVPPECVKYIWDTKKLEVKSWVLDGYDVEVPYEDIIHLHVNRKTGFVAGTPSVVAVIQDILALRRTEQNLEIFIHLFVFPIIVYMLAESDDNDISNIDFDGEDIIVKAQEVLNQMMNNGGAVLPPGDEIEIKSASNNIDYKTFLNHIKARVFTGLGVSSVDMGEGDCHDEETEVLTENGWKKHYQINHDIEKIATFNQDTNMVEFHLAESKYVGQYTGDMIKFSGKHIDALVTPRHKMWVGNRLNNKWEKIEAEKLYTWDGGEFIFRESAKFDISHNHGDEFYLFPESRVRGQMPKEIKCSMIDFASFLGWFVAEGSLDKYNASLGRYRVNISQKKKDNVVKILELLDRMGVSYSYSISKRDATYNIKIYSKTLYKFLEEHIGHTCYNKNLPHFVFSWSEQCRQALLESLIDGDGSRYNHGGEGGAGYYTVSEKLADDVQILAISLGFAAKKIKCIQPPNTKNKKYYTIFRVGITSSDRTIRILNHTHVSKQFYSGEIFCYTVPNGIFLTRRNGKVATHGNSTNRATAETLSSVIIDSVKSIQKIIVDKINSELFRDILRENRTLKPEDVYIEKNIVQLFFNEIDLYYLIKYENHNSMMFAQNVITHTEARNRIGLDPLPESDKKGLFSIMFESVNEGAASATVATANPSNQHGSDSIKTQLLLEYTKELVENNIELNKELYDAFDTRFTQYNKKHLLDSCSPELFNVKISVAKSYFRQLANTVTN